MAKEWTQVEVATQIASVDEAFRAWNQIRDEAIAQAYLVSLLGSRGRGSSEPKLPKAQTLKRRQDVDSEVPPTV